MTDKVVLCGANSYEQKYYFNEEFQSLPQSVKDELHIMCVLFTEDVGGILTMEYDEKGNLDFQVISEEGDYLFDEIGSVLKIKEYQETKRTVRGFGALLQDFLSGRKCRLGRRKGKSGRRK